MAGAGRHTEPHPTTLLSTLYRAQIVARVTLPPVLARWPSTVKEDYFWLSCLA